MLDAETRDRCHQVALRAEAEGRNLWELAESAGLIVSVDERRAIQTRTLSWLYSRMELQPHTALANLGNGQTVTGAVNGCLKFIELSAEALEVSR